MAEFCGSLFWERRLTWDTPTPRFTPCFEATALSWFPLVFLVTLGFVDLYNVAKSRYKPKHFRSTFTILTIAKTLLSVILILVYASQLIRLGLEWGHEQLTVVEWMSPALIIFGHVITLLLCFYTKYRGIHSSACQFFFWTTSCLTQGFLFFTAVKQIHFFQQGTKDDIMNLSRLITFPIICIRFILELISDSSDHIPLPRNNPSPDKTSSFFSKLFFLWYDSMAWTGYKRTLTTDDLWELNPHDRSRVQSDMFRKYWDQDAAKAKILEHERNAGILSPLWKCFGVTFAFGILMRITGDCLAFVQPFITGALIAHVKTDVEPVWRGYFYVSIITVTSICQSVLSSSSSKRSYLTAMRVKSTLSNAVFRKTLLISSVSRKESSLGSIVNLQSVDALKLSDFLPCMNASFGSPIQIIISSCLLYRTLGPSVLVGVGILVIIIPISLLAVAVARKYQGLQMVLKDERVKLTSELVSGIKVLKLYAWEPSYQKRIEDIRNKELGYLRKIAVLNTFTVGMNHAAPVFVSIATFATYVLTDSSNILNAEKAFVAINLFNIMKNALIMVPMLFGNGIQAYIAVQRLNKYLNMEELDKSSVTHDDSFENPIVIRNASFSWDAEKTTLKNINFSVKTGELVAIVGRIGSGKSSLLSALLGDLTKVNGVINLKGTSSYVSQTAWIQNATLKDNILFQDPLIQNRYKMVVDSCALLPDLEQLPCGDETEIGENGINLSGGQKQRVALARAAYKDASIYLFDDPLSAVDAHVGKHIFDNLIGPNGILRNKTRVLVTHGVSFLPYMNRIFVMKDGEISESGTYRELLAKQGEFADFLQEHLGTENDENVEPCELSVRQDLPELIPVDRSVRSQSVHSERRLYPPLSAEAPPASIANAKLVGIETTSVGNIKLNIFAGYFRAAGFWVTLSALLFSILSNALAAYSNVWLSQWVSESTLEEITTGSANQHTTDKYLTVYGIIAVAQGVFAFAGTWAIALVCLAAAKNLQSQALSRVIRAPMSYFDTTLMGRLINRFSKDMDTLDNTIPVNLRTFALIFFHVLTTFVVIAYANPEFIAFVIPMGIFYMFLQRFYVATSRQLKRLDGITRSPIYSHFSETVSGCSVIRAFRLQEKFITESEGKVDTNQMAYFCYSLSNMWIAIRLELLGALVILSTCTFTLLSRGSVTPGTAGLGISYAFQVTLMLNLMARQMSDLESNIVSAERVEELTHIPQEAPWSIPNTTPPPSWPEHGELKIESFKTKYRDGLELVLKGVSCTIASGEKIGVVGRTGAGKSSLTLALFRLIESTGGTISIDGINITTLGLHDLRKKITIIPQDPVIFSGTLRLNLDPFNEYSDEEVWRCLELAHLKSYVTMLKGNLGYKLEEEGKNFSVGQRQLICLSRALLRKTKILILDEATAAVDLETDDLIQATIRREFRNCTVITIAHRLNTILDSDRVLVLQNGEIKEFDSPASLLENPSSVFSGMARDAKII